MSENKQMSVTDRVQDLLVKSKASIAAALPRHIDSDRFARIALTEFKKNPKLKECDPMSFLAAIMTSAQLGLEPGPLGHCYLIPYKDQIELQISYKGLIALALRSGDVLSISGRVVYENDIFEVKLGTDETILHTPSYDNPGAMKLVYAVATLKNGGKQFEVMTKAQIEEIKKLSKGLTRSDSPWINHYNAMAIKTVIKRLIKYLPVSTDVAIASSIDSNEGNQNLKENLDDSFETTATPVSKLNKALLG